MFAAASSASVLPQSATVAPQSALVFSTCARLQISQESPGEPGQGRARENLGKGDGKFNFKDIVPDLYNTTIFDEDKAQTPVSKTLGVDGFWGGLAVDLLTDPTTYIGAGLVKNIVAKSGKNILPKITKKFLTKGAKSTDDIIKQTAAAYI